MRFGAIPPFSASPLIQNRKYHLALAGELRKTRGGFSSLYQTDLQSESDRGAFVCLDNGAYEDSSLRIDTLLTMADGIGASELILPDVLFDSKATVEATMMALTYISGNNGGWFDKIKESGMRLAIVPQGRTVRQWELCCNDMIRDFREILGDDIPMTIAIAKHTGKWPGGRNNLFERFLYKHQEEGVHINLLGVSEDIHTLASMAMHYPYRSIDSAKPFIYAMYDMELVNGWAPIPDCPSRPNGYFEAVLDDFQIHAAQTNIKIYTERLSPELMQDREILK